MAAENNDPTGALADRVLQLERLFDAPRELVFEAFTDPAHLTRWWGPHGCTVVACATTPVVGGTWQITMRSPRMLPQFTERYPVRSELMRTGAETTATADDEWIIERQRGVYQEVVRPERLVFTYCFEDAGGRPLHQSVVTITFAAEGDHRTRLVLRQAVFASAAVRDDHVRGWSEALEHLAGYFARPQ